MPKTKSKRVYKNAYKHVYRMADELNMDSAPELRRHFRSLLRRVGYAMDIIEGLDSGGAGMDVGQFIKALSKPFEYLQETIDYAFDTSWSPSANRPVSCPTDEHLEEPWKKNE